jgi:hypothetical protein
MREAEKKRLVKLIEEAGEGYELRSVVDIADYLLENGVIVPPCQVGDKLYAISGNRIEECICDEISICAEFQCDYDCKGCPFYDWKQDFHTGEHSCGGEYGTWFFSLKDFGKTVFLSEAEAKYALKNRRSVSLVNGHIEE